MLQAGHRHRDTDPVSARLVLLAAASLVIAGPAEGQTVQVMVMNIQKDQRRIALSRRAVVELEERRDMQPFLAAPQEERKVRMKDILQGDAFKRFFEKS